MLFWMNTQIIEIKSFNKDVNIRKSKLKYGEWASSISYGVQLFNNMFRSTQSKLKLSFFNPITYVIMRKKHKKFQANVNTIIAKENSQLN